MPFTIKGIGVVNATPLHPDDTLNEEEYRRHTAGRRRRFGSRGRRATECSRKSA